MFPVGVRLATRPLEYGNWIKIANGFSDLQMDAAVVAINDEDMSKLTPFGQWLLSSPIYLSEYLTHPDKSPTAVS